MQLKHQYHAGTNNNSEHKGNWHIKNGVSISHEVACAVVDAAANATALKAARGERTDFEMVKKIVNAALFAASMAERSVHYINDKVEEQQKAPRHRYHQQPPDGYNGASYRGETDELY